MSDEKNGQNGKKPLYSKVESDLDPQGREAEVLRFWKENGIFNKSVAARIR